jgi:hypothetical protein
MKSARQITVNNIETNNDWLDKLDLNDELQDYEYIGVSKELYDVYKHVEFNNTTFIDTERGLVFIGWPYKEPLLIGYYK